MKREIIFVTPQMKSGGGNRVFIELANVLVETCDVKIIFPNNSTEANTFLIDSRVELIPIGNTGSNNLFKVFNVIKTFLYINRKHKKSHVITSDPIMSIIGFLLRVKFRYRFVQSDDYNIFNDGMVINNVFFLWVYKVLTWVSFRYNFTFIFNSLYSYNKFVEIYPSYSGGVKIVHPAINPEIFCPSTRKNLVGDIKQICLVARKHPLKGLSTFIEAWHGLPDYIKLKVAKIILISHDDLTSFELDSFSLIKPKSDMEIGDLYRESDIFISTSLWEGFGLPPLEAMASGCAVITSKSGGVNEYSKDGINCIMFEPGDVFQLQECIIKLIDDPDMVNRLRKNGKLTATKFNWKFSASQLLDHLHV